MLKIAIGADHRGFEHKKIIESSLSIDTKKISWIDVGTFSEERTDYPIFARDVARIIQSKKADLGILICGSGIGMAVAANRFAHIYAGVVWNELSAQRAREEDNVNILVLPADFIMPSASIAITLAWLNAAFKGDRYQERITTIDSWGGI